MVAAQDTPPLAKSQVLFFRRMSLASYPVLGPLPVLLCSHDGRSIFLRLGHGGSPDAGGV